MKAPMPTIARVAHVTRLTLLAAVAAVAIGASAQSFVMPRNGATGNGLGLVPQRSGDAPVYYGPASDGGAQHSFTPGVGHAPEWISQMSPRCAALNDALRTAPARGLASATVAEMSRNYQRECADNESEARNQWSRDRGEKRTLANNEAELQRRSMERGKLQQQQCDESKRILVTKKRRTDLTEGERGDLQRFEANYHQRCD
jgi:hypothetical protein